MPPLRRSGWRRVAAVAGGFVALVVGLAILAPPRHIDFGGGDEENYLANGVRQADRPDAGYRFLPPEWEALDTDDREALATAFLDAEGRLFRLSDLPPDEDDGRPPVDDPAVSRKKVTVDDTGAIEIAHDNLYATVLAAARTVDHRRLPYHVNHLLLATAVLLFGDLVRRLTRSTPAGIVAGGLLAVLPSMLETTLITRTENLALLLGVGFAWAMVRSAAATAYPGLLLVALFMTRHEYVVPLLLFIGWAALARKRGGWVVVAATVAAAYGFAWGPAEPGDLFPSGRDVLAFVPAVPAWVLIPVFAAAGPLSDRLALKDRAATAWLVGPWPPPTGKEPRVAVHRSAWLALIGGAIGAEAIRHSLEVGERALFIFKGERLSTLGALIDSSGWVLVAVGLVGLVWQGPRMAGRLPPVVVLVAVPFTFALVRLSSSSADLYGAARRFNPVLLPVLVLGVALIVAAVLESDRLSTQRRTLLAVVVVGAVLVGLVGPYGRRPGLVHPTLTDVDRFHADAERLEPDSIVVLSERFGSMKSVLPLRLHHDRWAFVVWDEDAAIEALTRVAAHADRPVYVQSSMLHVAAAAGADPTGEVVTVDARYNERPAAALELHRVDSR